MERLTSSERGGVWNRPGEELNPAQLAVLRDAYEIRSLREEFVEPQVIPLDERRRAYVGAFLVEKGFRKEDADMLPDATVAEISKRAPDGQVDDEELIELVSDGKALQQMTDDVLSDTIVA